MSTGTQDIIEIGDKVQIDFSTHPSIVGEVLYRPQATGDSWHIRDNQGQIAYVQQFDIMWKSK